jgi:hypothetical protein
LKGVRPACRRTGSDNRHEAPLGRPGHKAKLANSIDRSNTLHKTYAPGEIEAVKSADLARLRGRRKMRTENEKGEKVSPEQPSKVSPAGQHAAK